MAFKKQYTEKGLDTTQMVGGYLRVGTHLVTIEEVTDLQNTIKIQYKDNFGNKFTDTIFVAGLAGENYSRKMTDLLASLPTEVLQEVAEDDDFSILEGQELRITLARSQGNYIEKRGVSYVVVGDPSNTEYPSYTAAKTALDMLGNRAYVRVVDYLDKEYKTSGGVW